MASDLDPTFRGSDGNVGIIRSPLRAIALPDQSSGFFCPVIRIIERFLDPVRKSSYHLKLLRITTR